MRSRIATFVALAAAITGGSAVDKTPVGPELSFLLTASVAAGDTITIGPEQNGTRVALPVAGGNFIGPYINGTLLPVGVDAGLFTADNKFNPDGIAILQTTDGANIIYRNKGYQVNDTIYGATTFETGHPKYSWLNSRILVSSAVLSTGNGDTGIALNIFLVGPFPSPANPTYA